MGELGSILSPALKDELIRGAIPVQKRMVKPATVARRQQLLALDAWHAREHLVEWIAHWGVFAWHAARPLEQVRAMYCEAARSYYDLLQVIDFAAPVEHLYSVTGRDAKRCEEQLGVKFVRLKRDRYDQTYGVYLEKLRPYDYAAEYALICAMIAQDWGLADSLAKEIPVPLSTKARETMSLSLLRYTALDQKEHVEQRSEVYSAQASGIDFPPRRFDFAIAIVHRDNELLAKAVKATIQSFRRKWKLDKYVTPSTLRRYGTREKVVDAAVRDLCSLHWAYSPWAVAMMCLASRVGMEIPGNPKAYSDFVPHALCIPAS